MDVSLVLALLALLVVVWSGLEVGLGVRHIGYLRDVPVPDGPGLPKVSVIIPALNEEKTIAPALASVLALDYDGLEVVVVNDRSFDGTGAVLEDMQRRYPALRICQIASLPQGWLGKNHALNEGAALATGDFLLFTDADVVFERTTLQRAMRYATEHALDHLCLFFNATVPGGLLNILVIELGGALLYLLKPWQAKDPKSRRYMGVGAFNLVRASAYRQSGGHAAIAMCPVDDVMLGKLLKQKGFRQEALFGHGFVDVAWYSSLAEFSAGLMKNIYAAFDYSMPKVALITLLQSLGGVMPLWLVFFGAAPARIVGGLVVALRFFAFASAARDIGVPFWYGIWSLVSPYCAIYITWKAVLTTLWRQGIVWRGTFYPLAELRAKRL